MNSLIIIAQVNMSTEAAIGLVVLAFGGVASALGFVFRLLINNLTTDRDNWKQVATEAVGNLRKAANAKRLQEGRTPYEDLVPVVPEHNSPVTKEQLQTAELQTVRASLVAATLDLGLPAREMDVVSKASEVADGAKEVFDKLAEEKATIEETAAAKAAEQIRTHLGP